MFRLTGLYSIVRRAVCNGTEDIVKGKFFYAVRKGFKPGVYKTWDECKSQVDKFPYASYKKFAAEKDAWEFVRGQATSITPDVSEGASYEATLPRRAPEALEYIPIGQKRHYDHIDEEEMSPAKQSQYSRPSSKRSDGFTYIGDAVVVYTDGCCSGNGKAGARAGIGVYWGRDHPLNVAEPLDGRQTNQRAELQAACKALEQAKEMNIKKLVLYTDSKFTINGVTSWVKNWKLNNWRLNSGGPVINKEDFEKLDMLNEELEVVWLHIPGHAGYLGNEEADRLSRDGAAKHLD
ncbi:ribonuclease H1 [Salmo salar]|uniref:Ribonuclease H1 n=1 Tax=Salmo salar TaxID=8030 RepID=B5XH14_SALSA|nr:ribonuclease H1 [Salmo salar]ACI70134.1 Ribonuclease H1 [Salmo salar]|eukprot:NP_001135083.1 Ribonuclease H1 [Salmo salar]